MCSLAYLIEGAILYGLTFSCLLGLVLLAIACIVALFKIEEADRYYGTLGGERLCLTFLPWSMWRMTEYGMVILFARTRVVQRLWGNDLALIEANQPPMNLKRLLVWLYASWFLCGCAALIAGTALWLLV